MDENGVIEESQETKLDNNICRAKAKIYDYAMSNDWSYFCTFTIDVKRYDRYNLPAWYKSFAGFLNDFNTYHRVKLSYLFVPELHQDGAWHLHGFIDGLPERFLAPFVPGLHPQYLIDHGYLNWPDYEKRFGFCSFARIRQKEAVSAYILKYIGKGLRDRKNDFGAPLYYATKGLKKAVTIKDGLISPFDLDRVLFAYENEFVKTSFYTWEELRASPLFEMLDLGDMEHAAERLP